MSFQPGRPRSAYVSRDPSASRRSSRPSGDETISRRPSGCQAVHSGSDSTWAITSLRPSRSTASTSPAVQSEKYSRSSCHRGDSTTPRPVSSVRPSLIPIMAPSPSKTSKPSKPSRPLGCLTLSDERAAFMSSGRGRPVRGLVDRPVRLDGLQLVPAGVALHLLPAAGLEQLDEPEVLAESLLGTVRKVGEHGRAHPVEAGVRLLDQLGQVRVGAPGHDGLVQQPVELAEPHGIGPADGLLHARRDLAQPG